MQAQMLRLDTLGERLVRQADLDAVEFDFNMPPPTGGPHIATILSTITVPDFLGMLEELDMTAEDRETKLMALEQLIMNRNLHERIIPSGRAVEHGLLSSKYGKRIDPFTGKQENHKGIDISSKEGSSILAVADGVVTWSGGRTGYGKLVEINHGNGYVTRYGHNKQNLVKAGDTVRKGEAIALMGSTGRSTGPHVHIEVVRDGKQVNPNRYLYN
jgi:murein DD-endopeptidase MepM/ murein hydrolase activator NlpD